MPALNLRDIVNGAHSQFPSKPYEIWMDRDLPNSDWPFAFDFEHLQRFSRGENIRVTHLKRWLDTDTYVGLDLILWNDMPLAFIYQSGRKSSANWFFLSEQCYQSFFARYLSYADSNITPEYIVPAQHSFWDLTFDPTLRTDDTPLSHTDIPIAR